jgi:hypothetical protein
MCIFLILRFMLSKVGMTILSEGADIRPDGWRYGSIFHPWIRPAPAPWIGGHGAGFIFHPRIPNIWVFLPIYMFYLIIDFLFDSMCQYMHACGTILEYFMNVFACVKKLMGDLKPSRCRHGCGHGRVFFTPAPLPSLIQIDGLMAIQIDRSYIVTFFCNMLLIV